MPFGIVKGSETPLVVIIGITELHFIIMSKRNISEQQIQEYLNQDSRRSSLVSDMINRGVSRFEPVIDPVRREQLNMLDISNVGNFVNKIRLNLQTKSSLSILS